MPHRTTFAALTSAALLTALVTSCSLSDPGPQRTQERGIIEVTQVQLATSGDLTVRTGPAPRLTITAGDHVIDLLGSDVEDGRLLLDLEGHVGRLGPVHYELAVPVIDSVVVTGSGHVELEEPSSEEIALAVEGSGDIEVHGAAARTVAVQITGSGDVTVSGTTGAQEVRLEGSGTYRAQDLHSERATVSVEGSGAADVHATGSLEARVAGSGSVRYSGGPQVRQDVDGSGEVVGS